VADPNIAGWDGGSVVGEESSAGTTWGEYKVVGVRRRPLHALGAGETAHQPGPPALADGIDPSEEMLANDPTKLILNVRSPATSTSTSRPSAKSGAAHCAWAPGVLGSGVDGVTGIVDAQVIVDDGTLQRQFDETFGVGVVRIMSALQPLDRAPSVTATGRRR
jgi:hypothetical protein